LSEVERGQAHSDALLRAKAVMRLSAADRNLATALVLGTLRWQLWLDQRIRPLLKRPNAKLDMEVRIALRLGAFQLLCMDRIPARAAIDESVELTRQAGHRFASGMVNAVLRKLATHADTHADRAAAACEAYPAWMVDRWMRFYGEETAQAICAHGQAQATQTLRIADPSAAQEFVAAGVQIEPGALLTAASRVTAGDVTGTAAFDEGRVRLQDEGSQLVAEVAGSGNDILDCCAAPGGKTMILADRNPQAHVTACESSEQRLAHLRKRLAALGERVECRLADATTIKEESVYDLALADVPCSGTGTLGRNPEIRHRLQVNDLPRQAERQKAILRATFRALRPGGRVVYSTCSLEPEENEEVVAAVLAERPDVQVASMRSRIDTLQRDGIVTDAGAEKLRACVTNEGYLRLLPGAFSTDGFFIAVLEKTAR
jgi:16S rRNA (cytosine967-C5)-methyltransferase